MAYEYIDREECIGDSLYKINNNSVNFDTRILSLSGQVASSVLFVPANYNTLSNQITNLVNWSQTGNTVANPWWSGIQTATIDTPPTNTVGVSILGRANTNSQQNNFQKIYFYNSTEQGLAGVPSTSTSPANITTTQRDAVNDDFLKMTLDPTGGTGVSYEGETHATFHVYLNSSNQFNWFWVDQRTAGTPTSNPSYSLELKVLGYYVKVV